MFRPFSSDRRLLLGRFLGAAAALTVPAVQAQPKLEKPRLTVVVTGKSGFGHLPLTVADQLGYFRAEGLTLDIQDVAHSHRALELMAEGAAEICAGSFEHLFALQSRGMAQQCIVLQARIPQVALGVSSRSMPYYRSVADLKGKRIGVAEPGSLAGLVVKLALARAGLKPEDVSFVEVGPSMAQAALRSGQIDALSHLEPVMTALEQRGEVKIVSDTRTLKGTTEMFGGLMPSACLHASADFVQRHPGTCQALANGIVHALKWLQTAGPGDIIKTVPESYFLGDRALYLAAFNKIRETISPDGLLPVESARTALQVLSGFDPAIRPERIAVEKIFTNEFARRAKERFRA